MKYVDGYVVPVPTANQQAYRNSAAKMAPIYKEYGALRVVECWSDNVPRGKVTDFYRSVQATDTESVVFSWIEWPSKEVRDQAQPKMEADPRMKDMDMPFDGKRLIYGGFAVLHEDK